jgi:hypothetical protein
MSITGHKSIVSINMINIQFHDQWQNNNHMVIDSKTSRLTFVDCTADKNFNNLIPFR